MQNYEFKMFLSRLLTAKEVDKLYKAGFDDSAIGVEKGSGFIDTRWQGYSYSDAVQNAKKALKDAVENIQITRVEEVKN